ncbi:MAG: DnaJ domain-containing protein [Myxococcales bacterium]|nr:DnaJ domain-containing protein [Myxococcales bacterium]
MAHRNYYMILGVASSEGDRGIRAAYRDLARRHHPDHAGPAGAAAFREATEAYAVLGDPDRRRRYDDEMAEVPVVRAPAGRPAPGRFVRDLSLLRDAVEARPSIDELFGRFERNFTGIGVPKGEHLEPLQVDVAISPEEADRGTTVLVGVPTFDRCRACLGLGCEACGERGMVERDRPVAIFIPPLSGRGMTFVMPLDGFGIHNFYLSFRVRVSPDLESPGRP